MSGVPGVSGAPTSTIHNTVRLNVLVAVSAGLDESATLTLKVKVPVAVGLPEMVPVAESVKPGGR